MFAFVLHNDVRRLITTMINSNSSYKKVFSPPPLQKSRPIQGNNNPTYCNEFLFRAQTDDIVHIVTIIRTCYRYYL